MVSSVHTNSAAMSALQVLNKTNSDLEQTQNRVASGYKVGGARDDSAVFAVAQGMRGDIGALAAVRTSLDRANSIVDVAIAGSESISDLLIELRSKALAASDTSINGAARSAYDEDFKSLISQISTIISNSEFDGANLLDGSQTNGIGFIADIDSTDQITLDTENLSLGGSIITFAATASLGTATLASGLVSTIDTSLNNVNAALSRLGATANRVDTHVSFVSKLSDSLEQGVGNLVDADLSKESARLQALQVKQQLGVQALSIANQNSQTILSLFQG
ncbi:flagellin [Ponticaulis sp.]|uniref:flagellin n=1 Tax=Ponticaulis sp. TaxID=2020902 RepID=UPI000C66974C|nr:flagellin [Ponticaulis sp.]MBN05708.1 flagellin [Ponticaulis sp.]